MHANHAARADARRARLAAKTRACKRNKKSAVGFPSGFPRDECSPRASPRLEQKQFAERLVIETFRTP
jgi:hypothetical protein